MAEGAPPPKRQKTSGQQNQNASGVLPPPQATISMVGQQTAPVNQGAADMHGNMPLDKGKVQEVLGLNNMWKPDANSQASGSSIPTTQFNNLGNCSTADVIQPKVSHPWHDEVKEDLRNYLIQKLFQNFFPYPDLKISINDSCMVKLLNFARKVEGIRYEQAKSEVEYFHVLAENICKVKRDMEERRSQKGNVAGVNTLPAGGAGLNQMSMRPQQPAQQFSSTNQPRMINNPNQPVQNQGLANPNVNVSFSQVYTAGFLNGNTSDTMSKVPVNHQASLSNVNMPQIQQNSSNQIVIQNQHGPSNTIQAGLSGTAVQPAVQTVNRMRSSTVSSSANVDPEKRRLIQHQLFLLLHAHKCLKSGVTNQANACAVPYCQTMKTVLQHMIACTDGKECQVPHCASSRQIIAHWKQCKREDCSVCSPLKNQHANSVVQSFLGAAVFKPQLANPANPPAVVTNAQSRFPGQQNQNASGVLPPQATISMVGQQTAPINQGAADMHSNIPLDKDKVKEVLGLNNMWKPDPNSQASGSSIPTTQFNNLGNWRYFTSSTANVIQPKVSHPWHDEVKEEFRNYLVQKLVQNIFPSPDLKIYIDDARMVKLLNFARKVEGIVYEQAKSEDEYLHFLAENICKIKKALKERRSQKGNAAGVNTLPAGGAGSNQMSMRPQQPAQQFSSTNQTRMINNPNQLVQNRGLANPNVNVSFSQVYTAGFRNGNTSDTMSKFSIAKKEIEKATVSLSIQVTGNDVMQQSMNSMMPGVAFQNQGQEQNSFVSNNINQQNNMVFTDPSLPVSVLPVAGNSQVQSSQPLLSSGSQMLIDNNSMQQSNVSAPSSQSQIKQEPVIMNATDATQFPSVALSSVTSPTPVAPFVNRKLSSDAGSISQTNTAMQVKTEITDNSSQGFYGTNSSGKALPHLRNVKVEKNSEDLQSSVATTTSNISPINVKIEPKTEPGVTEFPTTDTK